MNIVKASTTRAVLDEDDVLVGYDDNGNGPEVPVDCDLELGKYAWSGHSFIPVKQTRPNREAAIAEALIAINNGQDFPKTTLEYLEDYEARKKKGFIR